MSAITSTPPQPAVAIPPVASPVKPDVLVSDKITVPGWVVDLDSYRRWAKSDEYPESGWVSFLDGTIFVDPNMEELWTHNQVKGAYAITISNLLAPAPNGAYVFDRMLLSNAAANLSSEPDGLFFFWETVRSNRLKMVEGADGYIELFGTPDMTLEVVSKHSIRKDTKKLRQLYWKAGIPEYWLVDARGPKEPTFEILQFAEKEYVAVEAEDGWVRSTVFNREFRIRKSTNPLGQPQFVVEVKA